MDGNRPSASDDAADSNVTVSIITPTLNRAHMIGRAIDSVTNQRYANIEHVVVDGGSTDRTGDIVKADSHLVWLRGRDANAHDAMNKGVAASKGEIVGFLNSDDTYAAGILSTVANSFASDPELQAVAGRALLVDNDNAGDRRGVDEFIHVSDPSAMWTEVLYGAPAFNSWFFRRSLLERFGDFDVSLHVAADREFLLRLLIAGEPLRVIDQPAYYYLRHDGSATLDPAGRVGTALLREHVAIADRHIGARLDARWRARLKAWRAWEALRLAVRLCREGGLASAAPPIMDAFANDPAWLTRVPAALGALRQLRRIALAGQPPNRLSRFKPR